MTKSFGALPSTKDVRDYKLKKEKGLSFPDVFILTHPRIKDQGNVSSCVAHSIAEVIEYFNREQEKLDVSMSTGYIYGNRRESICKGEGMYVRDALKCACKYGTTYDGLFYENVEVPEAIRLFEERYESIKDKALPNRLSTYFRLTSEEDIKRALMNYGPVVFAMKWREDTTIDNNGILQINSRAKNLGGHCMLIYGWCPDGWLIQNSWGRFWGEEGCAILPYNIKLSEAWGVTDEIIDGKDEIRRFYNTTFTRWLAKVFNWFLNLFRRKK